MATSGSGAALYFPITPIDLCSRMSEVCICIAAKSSTRGGPSCQQLDGPRQPLACHPQAAAYDRHVHRFSAATQKAGHDIDLALHAAAEARAVARLLMC